MTVLTLDDDFEDFNLPGLAVHWDVTKKLTSKTTNRILLNVAIHSIKEEAKDENVESGVSDVSD